MLTKPEATERPARPGRKSIRTAILEAARRLYLAHGTEGVSARKIAREVGCSPTAIYLYYRSIGDLLGQLRIEGHLRLSHRLRSATGPDAIERVRAMGRAYFSFGKENPSYYALMFSLHPADVPGREAVQREMQTLLVVRDAVQAGMLAGEIRPGDATVVANTLWAQIHGVTALSVCGLLLETAAGHDHDVLEAVLESAVEALRPQEKTCPKN